MKRFKFYLLTVFSLCVIFSSCTSEFDYSEDETLIEEIQTSTQKTSVSVESLPNGITSELDECYFETYIDEVLKVQNKGYEIKLGDGEYVYYNMEQYMLQSRMRHRECGDTERAEIQNHKRKMFQFGNRKENGESNQPSHGDTITATDLPENVTNYISTNYPDEQIVRAKIAEDFYIVKLTSPNVLKFDMDGNYVDKVLFIHNYCQGTSITFENIPVVISEYISTNYPTSVIKEAMQHVEKYEIRLIDGENRILLMFDIEGNFLFERICD
jgi:hypothetical protein